VLRRIFLVHHGLYYFANISSEDRLCLREWSGLSSILATTQWMDATEPRDRIFALYGVIQEMEIEFPKPDYGKPVEQVYRDATRAAINFDGDLNILLHATGFQSSACASSWSLDWCGELRPPPLSSREFYASTNESQKSLYSFSEDGKRLTVSGKVLDIILSRSEHVIISKDEVHSVGDFKIPLAHMIENIIYTFQEWVALSCNCKGFPEYISGDSVAQALFQTLVQNGSNVENSITKLPWLQEGFQKWLEFLFANILPIGIGMDKVEALLEEQSSENPKIPPWLPEDMHYLTQSEQWKIMRAIEQNPMAKLFHVHAFLGAIKKAFFITENGYIGTASHSIAAGDQIVLLFGLRVPIVLRKGDDGRSYRLMGPAFVNGVMYGEVWKETNPELAQFTIV
jgi:hypothetical protein